MFDEVVLTLSRPRLRRHPLPSPSPLLLAATATLLTAVGSLPPAVAAASPQVAASPLDSFLPPVRGTIFAAADLHKEQVGSEAACAALCVSYAGPSFRDLGCISFNVCGSAPPFACGLQGYNRTLVPRASPSCALYQRVLPRNDTRVSARVPFLLSPPPPRSVTLLPGALRRLYDANVGFLLSFPVDDLLFNFRKRAGRPQPAGAACIGWDCKPDWVEGSLAAQYLMGAGNHLVWEEEPRLRAGLDALLAGIAECAQPNGYMLAFPEAALATSEHPDYVLSWTVHGLLAAHAAGAASALPLARAQVSLFNNHTLLPTFLPPDGGTPPWQSPAGPPPPGWNGVNCTGHGTETGHTIYLISQGIIHNTQMALSPAGTQADIDVAVKLYAEDAWLEQLAAGDPAAIWRKQWFSHNYEITALEAYLDLYVLTGDERFLTAVLAAWAMWRAHFLHVGGSVAVNENWYYPPGSYYLTANSSDHQVNWHNHATGELCGGVFWLKLNARLHRLYPAVEAYVGEMEQQLVNEAPAHQHAGVGIRHFSVLGGLLENATSMGNCCEGQGTRLYASTQEHLFALPQPPLPDGVSVDLYFPAVLTFVSRGGVRVSLAVTTAFPLDGRVTIAVTVDADVTLDVALRVPSWVAQAVPVTVDGVLVGSGEAGSYFHVTRAFYRAAPCAISLNLPFALRAHDYTGVTQVPPFVRSAVTYGPVLLAATGAWDAAHGAVAMPPEINPATPTQWLEPLGNLTFRVRGSSITLVPLGAVNDGELFSVYPLFTAAAGHPAR